MGDDFEAGPLEEIEAVVNQDTRDSKKGKGRGKTSYPVQN